MKPILDRVIIEQQAKETTRGSVLLPDSAQTEKPKGTVIAIGEDVKEVKIGDTVLFNVNYHQKFTLNGSEYVTIVDKDILAILHPEDEVFQTKMNDEVGVQVQ